MTVEKQIKRAICQSLKPFVGNLLHPPQLLFEAIDAARFSFLLHSTFSIIRGVDVVNFMLNADSFSSTRSIVSARCHIYSLFYDQIIAKTAC
jgi:hypothetical protein